jgi:PTS system nitrogen regulatory IIA component
MDLTLKDVAELLNVSESTISRWLEDKMIPAYKIKDEYRFSRIEIENWMMNRDQKTKVIDLKDKEAEKIIGNQMGTHAFCLFRALHKGGVLNHVKGKTKEEVLENAVRIIAQKFALDADLLSDLILEREKLMPTSLNHGVGVPHTRDYLIQKSFDIVTVVYPEEPIEYNALDGKKVHTLFVLLACDDKRHLQLLAKLAHLTRSEEALDFLQKKPDYAELLEYIRNWESHLRTNVEKATI